MFSPAGATLTLAVCRRAKSRPLWRSQRVSSIRIPATTWRAPVPLHRPAHGPSGCVVASSPRPKPLRGTLVEVDRVSGAALPTAPGHAGLSAAAVGRFGMRPGAGVGAAADAAGAALALDLQRAGLDQLPQRLVLGGVVGDLSGFLRSQMEDFAAGQRYPERHCGLVDDRLHASIPSL